MAKKEIIYSDAAETEITDLTICRGLLALWVFAYHVDLHVNFQLGWFNGLLSYGYLGVDGFFILSGLLLAMLHREFENTLRKWPRFIGRRLARIYPVHLAVIVLLAVLAAAGLVAGVKVDDPARFSFVGLLQNLLLMQGWCIGPRWSWNYPSWSVSSEWAGYLAFPVLFFYLSKLENIVVGQYAIVCWPILGLMGYFSGQGLNLAYADALPRFFLEFLWGVCTARMIPLFADELPTRGVAIAGLVFILIGTLIGAGAFALFGLWVVITSLTMNKDARRAPVFNRIGFLRPLGLISYSFYMSFATAELLIAQLFRHLGWHPADEKLVYTLAMIAVTSALAVSLYVLVEKPSRRALDRWMAPKPEPEPVVAPGKGKGKQQLARIKPRKMEVRE